MTTTTKARLTHGNEKLGTAIWNFNISPIISCGKYATKECLSYCYGKKGNFRFPSNVSIALNNFLESQGDNFVNDICGQIADNWNSIKHIRIHATGEFYDNEYFSKWIEIAKRNPEHNFVAYTKNYDIDCSSLPVNFIVRESITHGERNKTIKGKAYVIQQSEMKSNGLGKKTTEHLVMFTNKDSVTAPICNSQCRKCNYCYSIKNKDKDIFFMQH